MRKSDNLPIMATEDGITYQTTDGCKLFVYEYQPVSQYAATIFIIAGITGINHHKEQDIIELLSDNVNRVVVIHPRGTGYSEGKRGDMDDIQLFIDDFTQIISHDKDYTSGKKLFLFGHSISTAVLLAAAARLSSIAGTILVNPPYIQKKAKGMSPSILEYIKYAFYFLFQKNMPVVNMAGDPLRDRERRRPKRC